MIFVQRYHNKTSPSIVRIPPLSLWPLWLWTIRSSISCHIKAQGSRNWRPERQLILPNIPDAAAASSPLTRSQLHYPRGAPVARPANCAAIVPSQFAPRIYRPSTPLITS